MFSLFRSRLSFWLIAMAVFLGVLLLFNLPNLLVEWLWLDALEYSSVFWTIHLTQAALFGAVFLIVLLYAGANGYVLSQYLSTHRTSFSSEGVRMLQLGEVQIPLKRVNGLIVMASILAALFFAGIFSVRWDTFLRFMHAQPFGQEDPIFGLDIGFYVFELPVIELVQNNIASLAFLVTATLALLYAYTGGFTYYRQFNRMRVHPFVLKHLSANVVVLLLSWGWGYYLDRFELLFSSDGLIYGAGYVDMAVKHPALWVMVIATVALIGIVLINLRVKRLSLLAAGAGVYLLIHVGGLVILPGLIQRFTVEPNELELERPYIENNIALTRQAYGLDEIKEKSYSASAELTRAAVERNRMALKNVRLWDPNLLLQTYRQLQEIRLYYQFYHVDVDRYRLENGNYRQVMLSARELGQQLPAQASSWLNRRLQFTHGYGLTMNFAARAGQGGIPDLLIKNLPPVTSKGLTVEQAAIYYGEEIPGYKIVNTRVEELDYPQGDENVYTHYQGSGGILFDAYWKKLLFAYYLGDPNIILSDYITSESRLLLWNNVDERVRHIAPFLEYSNPYLVLSEGKLYWIVDAYTTSNDFPYSDPVRRQNLNYIRNSVKIVVDAYNGSVTFYAMGDDDPILQTYRQAFPDLFQEFSEMPADLKNHLRYPRELFNIQINKYNTYHMTVPQVFYNKEDLWERPWEQYAGQQIRMQPYYVLMRLPDQEQAQFVLMSPLTPANRDNMIAWIAAKSDFPGYGELVVYELPKDRLIYGPNQIEARIDQDTRISEQLSLWDQRGSNVIRGNLMTIPIENSFLYIEPVFLIAQGTELPQLQRVIVASGDHVVMAPTLEQSMNELFGIEPAYRPRPMPVATSAPRGSASVPAFAETARETLDRAREALREGRWAEFGEELEALGDLLDNPVQWQQEQSVNGSVLQQEQLPAVQQ